MIVENHPGLQLLREAPFVCHLVGSRYVGVYKRDSDYDFLIVAEAYGDLVEWLKENKFQREEQSYGKDPRLLSDYVWTRDWALHPAIDLIPVSPAEAELRMKVFRSMALAGDRQGGLLAKALKGGTAWPYFWATVAPLLEGFEK